MKHLVLIFLIAFTWNNISAQELSKSEKKQLKTQIRDLKKNPAKLKKLNDKLEMLDIAIEQQSEEISILKNNLQSRDITIIELKDSLNAVAYKLETTRESHANLNKGEQALGAQSEYQYRIQIGLFQNLDFTHLFADQKYLMHEDVDGAYRYSIGNFTSEIDAEAFKIEIRKLGIKDAFVTIYKDGKRKTGIETYVD
ncbi:MAG: hypothetical protein QNK51_03695 [Chitinophagales bacterium]